MVAVSKEGLELCCAHGGHVHASATKACSPSLGMRVCHTGELDEAGGEIGPAGGCVPGGYGFGERKADGAKGGEGVRG